VEQLKLIHLTWSLNRTTVIQTPVPVNLLEYVMKIMSVNYMLHYTV